MLSFKMPLINICMYFTIPENAIPECIAMHSAKLLIQDRYDPVDLVSIECIYNK